MRKAVRIYPTNLKGVIPDAAYDYLMHLTDLVYETQAAMGAQGNGDGQTAQSEANSSQLVDGFGTPPVEGGRDSQVEQLGLGTVETVELTLPGEFDVAPTVNGGDVAFVVTWASETKKTFLAAPTGADGVPSFRLIDVGDLPAAVVQSTDTAHAAVVALTGYIDVTINGSTRRIGIVA